MDRLKHFQKYKTHYEAVTITAVLVVNAIINATTRIMDQSRHGDEARFQLWEPFVWEISSVVSLLILLPGIVWLTRSKLSDWSKPLRTTTIYAVASLVFCLLHVAIMVIIREVVYASNGINYQFGRFWFELFYEYRKDALTFVLVILVIYGYRFIWSRLQGEASFVQYGESKNESTPTDRILVRKLGKEFIVKVADIDWLEASGNYVNLHVGERVYPLRQTITKLIDDIAGHGFCRVHRSYAVNLNAIESIETLGSGSGEIILKSKKVLNLSRTYHHQLKQQLSPAKTQTSV